MKTIQILLAAFVAAWIAPAAAALNVFATVPEWGALAKELGGDNVTVYTATNALQDPHHVEARPSLIARARGADLVVATGAELEVGWLPLVLQQAGNPKVQPGKPGYFEAAAFVALLGKPARLDRSEGDVHPQGDPHIQTDPRNIARVAAALAERLAQIDPANAAYYQGRHKQFAERWTSAVAKWERQAASLKGTPVVVQHKAFTYLINWLGTSSPSLPRLLWMMLEEGPSGLCFMNRKKSAVTELSSDNMRSGAPKLSPRHTS